MVHKQKGGAAMVRTQNYITETQRKELAQIAESLGKKQSEIIREGIDLVIERSRRNCRENVLREAAGMWKDRIDLPDYGSIHEERDRCEIKFTGGTYRKTFGEKS
jgi:hypothetical protein